MPTLAFPNLVPSAHTWGLRSNTQVFESPLTGSVQTLELPSPRWVATLRFAALNGADAALMRAFLASLRGRAGRFTLHDHTRERPRGTATAALVNGAGQTGTSLAVDGMGAGSTLLAGDYLSVNGELKMLTADATADGGGAATLAITPPLRSAPADNAVVTLIKPTATFMLDQDESTWTYINGGYYEMTISCVEVFA